VDEELFSNRFFEERPILTRLYIQRHGAILAFPDILTAGHPVF